MKFLSHLFTGSLEKCSLHEFNKRWALVGMSTVRALQEYAPVLNPYVLYVSRRIFSYIFEHNPFPSAFQPFHTYLF